MLAGEDTDILIRLCEPYALCSGPPKISTMKSFTFFGRSAIPPALLHRSGSTIRNEKELDEAMRSRIWEAKEAVSVHRGDETASFSIFPDQALKVAEEHPVTIFDHLFIDEAQATAMTLTALKRFVSKSIILASDGEQAIYQPGFSFTQAGIDVSDNRVILQENYRPRCRSTGLPNGLSGEAKASNQERCRWSNPELHRGRDGSVLQLVVERAMLFIERLEYEEENICIMCPSSSCYPELEQALKAGISSVTPMMSASRLVRSATGIFASPPCIGQRSRYSCRVALSAVSPRVNESYDESVINELIRKLLYVTMTRAIDHLNVFTLVSPKEEIIRELIAAF